MTLKHSYAMALKQFQKGRYTDVLVALNRLLDVNQDPLTYSLLAKTLLKLDMKEEAGQAFERAAEKPSPQRIQYLGNALRLHFVSRKPVDTLRVGRQLLKEALEDPNLAFPIAATLVIEGKTQLEKADIKMFWPVLAQSENAMHRRLAFQSLSTATTGDREYEIGRTVFQKYPDDPLVRSFFFALAINANDYESLDSFKSRIDADVEKGDFTFHRRQVPLINLRWNGNESLNYIAGRDLNNLRAQPSEIRRAIPHRWADKIRIGYISSDFWDEHAVMKALGGVLERHDRERFDIKLFCNTSQSHLERNETDRRKWGAIVPIRSLSDAEAAAEIRSHEIDILVDLQGHTSDSRVGVMNHSAAPIQATWLGFPGTVINTDIDYMICDHTVVPESSVQHFYEKLCRLPETFFPNDPDYRSMPKPVSRTTLGLPEDAFIFGCYHAAWKISPTTLDIWVRILNETEDSKLLIICGTKFGAQDNIRNRFVARGIAPERILFGGRMLNYDAHMDRIPLADLGLDTYPYNGHTTTSEKLWCGLPMLTYRGTNFASRVSESLLNAVGLPEMVATDPDDYVRRAVYFYNNREELAASRERLKENRFIKPLFDAERFCKHLEAGYEMMVGRAKEGLAPDHFDVPALPARTSPFTSR